MALLRPCGKLVKNLSKISLVCQVQRFNSTPKQVLVMCILHSPNKKIKFKKKQLNNRFFSHTSIDKNNNNNFNDDSGVSLITLLNRIEILSNEFENVKIDYNYLYDTIKIYAELNENVDSSIDIFLLNCCGEVLPDVKYKVRQKLTRQLWNLLREKNRVTSLNYYHALINIYDQNYQDINPEEFVKNMKIQPNEITYLHLLQAAAKTGDSKRTNYIISKLQEFNSVKISEEYSGRKDVDILLNNADLLKINSPNEIYGHLACGYALRGDINHLIEILNNYSLNHKQLLTVLKHICFFEEENLIENILRYIPVNEIVSSPMLANTIIELVHLGKINQALMIVDFVVANNEKKNSSDIMKNFLQVLVRADLLVSTILNIGNKMSRSNYYSIDNNAVKLLLLEESLHCGKEELSLSLMKSMMKQNIEIRPHYYWPLLIKAAENEGESGVFRIIDHMTKMDVRVDYKTLFEYVLPHINTLDPLNALKKLTNHGVKLPVVIIPLVSYLLAKGNINAAYFLINTIKMRISFDKILPSLVKAFEVHKDADGCAKLLKFSRINKDYSGEFLLQIINSNYCVGNNNYIIKNLINSFDKHNIYISYKIAESLMKNGTLRKNNLKIINIENKNLTINKNLQQVNDEDELKCHWLELKSKGRYSIDVLRKLFIISCENDDIKQTKLIEEEIKKYQQQLTPAMKSYYIKLLARHGKVDEMYALLVDLQKNYPTFTLDPISTVYATIALVSSNKVELAWDFIEKSKPSKFRFQRGCWKLLNLVAQSEQSTLTNLMMNSLVTKNYCEINTMILEPLITQHLVKNDLSSATKSFKFAANHYNMTPMHRELVYELIKSIKDNPSEDNKLLLQDVLDKINHFHGQETVDMDLLIAYARCNMLNELKMSLMNLQPKQLSLEKFLQRLSDENKLIILTRVLEVTIEIDWIDRRPICELLLKSYSNMDDCKGAIELWKKMKNEGIKPTVMFEKIFLTFLSVHKIQLPSTLVTREEYFSSN